MEQTVTETTATTTSKPSNNTLKYAFFGFLSLIFVLVLIFIGVIAYKAYSDNKVDSGVKEGEKIVKNNAASTISAVDFTEFDPEDPLAFIDFDKVVKDSQDAAKDTKYLKSAANIEDLTGKTTHQAVEFDFTSRPSNGSDTDLDMTMDIYVEYLEGYDAEAQQSFQEEFSSITDYGDLIEIMKSEEYQDLIDQTRIQIVGDFKFVEDSDSFSGDFEFTQIKGDSYMKLSDIKNDGVLSSDDSKQLAKIEGKNIKIGIEAVYALLEKLDAQYASISRNSASSMNSEMLTTFTTELIKVQKGEMNFEDTEYYDQLNKQLAALLEDADSEDIETIKRVGNPLRNEFRKFFKNTRFLTNYEEVESIRETSNLKCVSGELDTESILNNAERLMLGILTIAANDEASELTAEEVEEAREDIKAQFEGARMFKNSINLEVNTCNDEDSNELKGFGFIFKSDMPGSKANYHFDILKVTDDSDYEIDTPKVDVDATKDVIDYIEAY